MFETQNGAELSYEDNSFDRLIATHVLEHVYQPHPVLKEWRRVVKMTAYFPSLSPQTRGWHGDSAEIWAPEKMHLRRELTMTM